MLSACHFEGNDTAILVVRQRCRKRTSDGNHCILLDTYKGSWLRCFFAEKTACV